MIFRTGSVLIVGKCDVHILNNIYDFVKHILHKNLLIGYIFKSNIISQK